MIIFLEDPEIAMSRFASKLLLVTCGMLLSPACLPTGPAMAGPTLEVTQETTVGSQATYDNNWAQTFQVTGNASVNGGSGSQTITPFAQVAGGNVTLPNSGTAVLNSSAQLCQQFCVGFEAGGVVTGTASISPVGASTTGNVTLNSSTTNGVPAITLKTNEQTGGSFGASVISDNIGTASLQTQGSRKTTTSNSLSVF